MAKARTVRFTDEVKHSSQEPGAPLHRFHKDQVVAFEDPDAADYFVKLGWAERTKDEPQLTVSKGELDIDPETIQHATGLRVQDLTVTAEA